jgi:MFS family permease
VKIAIVLYALYNAAAMVASIPAGHATDRRGATVVMMAGALALLAGYVGFALAGSTIVLLGAFFVLAGIGKAGVETAQSAAVALLAPTDLRGSAFGALAASQSFANLAASAVAGVLWTLISPRVAFLYLAAWAAVSIVLLALSDRPRPDGA